MGRKARQADEAGEPHIPLCVRKIVRAMDDKNLKRNDTEVRAGRYKGRINAWLATGKIYVEEAVSFAKVLELPLLYVVDDAIKIQSPPPTRTAYETENFAARMQDLSLEPDEAIQGMRIVALMKDYNLSVPLVSKMLGHQFVEREQERLGRMIESREALALVKPAAGGEDTAPSSGGDAGSANDGRPRTKGQKREIKKA